MGHRTWAERQPDGTYILRSTGDGVGNTYRTSDDWLEEVVQRLAGQCIVTPEQALEERDLPVTDENLERIGERIFLCDRCGWYAETEELNNETDEDLCDECNECNEENEDG